jgi:hypothetical protein
MSKRKSTKSHKPSAGTLGVVKPASTPKRAGPTPALTGSEAEGLQAAPDTETRLPDLPGQEVVSTLAPVPPPELESGPALPPYLAEPELDVALVEVQAKAKEAIDAAIGETSAASAPAGIDRPAMEPMPTPLTAPIPALSVRPFAAPLGAIAGIEACQTLFMEMTRDNLDFAASLASMRSPLDIIDVATKFAGSQIGMYGRFSKAFVDITAGRQPR